MTISTLHSEWQTAFAEWHRHRTDETSKVEQTARINYLNFIHEVRKAKSSRD